MVELVRDLDCARRRLAAMALFPLWLAGVALVVAGGMPWLVESRDGSVLNAPFRPSRPVVDDSDDLARRQHRLAGRINHPGPDRPMT